MSVPTQSKLYKPILEILATAESSLSDRRLAELVSDRLNLTDADQRELIPSGVQSRIENRTSWAILYLKRAGFVHYPSRGRREITQQGREFLKSHEDEITDAHLRLFIPKHQQAVDNKTTPTVATGSSIENDTDVTPEELMVQGDQQLRAKLVEELLENIKKLTPDRFEQLVVNLLEKMGYGKGEAVGRSGDGGIDGIINQDPLGLEKVYIQAKRWLSQVGEPEIRNFSGSLDAKGAGKGVFITTSTFSSTAERTARNISAGSKFIRLIDGRELTALMVRHGVGVVTVSTYEVKKLDENYFAEEV